MYMITHAERDVRIPPRELGKEIGENIYELTCKEFEGKVCSDHSVTILISNVEPKGLGRIVYGDEAVYQKVEYDQLVFKVKEGEIFEGKVVSICNMGAFIRIGPVDALLYYGQVMDDFVNIDVENQRLVGRDTGRVLAKDDIVRARVTQIKKLDETNYKNSEFGLTMRQPGLGKLEWIEEDHAKSMKNAKGES